MLEEAMQLLAQKQYDASERLFRKLIDSGSHVAESAYGIGLIRLNTGQIDAAYQQFQDCLKTQPSHANALFYLGHIAELRKDIAAARHSYQKALESNPQHVGALKRLRELSPVQSPAATPHPEVGMTSGEPNDLYALLRRSTEPVEQEIARHLDAVTAVIGGGRRARGRAFLGRLIGASIIMGAIGIVVFFVFRNTGILALIVPALYVAIVGILLRLWIARVRSKKISVERDWLLMKSGFLSTRTINAHLFILSREEVSVRQTFLNRLTHDGTLQLGPITLRGFFRADELSVLSNHFLQVSMLNPTSRLILAAVGELKQIRSGAM